MCQQIWGKSHCASSLPFPGVCQVVVSPVLPRGGPCPARGVFRLELPSQAPWSFADEQRSEVPRLPGFLAAAGVAVTAAKVAQLCWAHARRPEARAPRASCCPPARCVCTVGSRPRSRGIGRPVELTRRRGTRGGRPERAREGGPAGSGSLPSAGLSPSTPRALPLLERARRS